MTRYHFDSPTSRQSPDVVPSPEPEISAPGDPIALRLIQKLEVNIVSAMAATRQSLFFVRSRLLEKGNAKKSVCQTWTLAPFGPPKNPKSLTTFSILFPLLSFARSLFFPDVPEHARRVKSPNPCLKASVSQNCRRHVTQSKPLAPNSKPQKLGEASQYPSFSEPLLSDSLLIARQA